MDFGDQVKNIAAGAGVSAQATEAAFADSREWTGLTPRPDTNRL